MGKAPPRCAAALFPKRKGPAPPWPGPLKAVLQLSLGNDGWRGFALSDVLRAASDAQESKHRGHS
jgi:hypothetical protein